MVTNSEAILQDEVLDAASREKFRNSEPALRAKQFSDILDAEGHQYVNFVQEGGGVWGVALVGYLYALEACGIRFLRIAGTSAGAINTMLIAALGDRSKNKSNRIRDILFQWHFDSFMDGKSIVRKLANRILKRKNYVKRAGWFIGAVVLFTLLFPFIALLTKLKLVYYFVPFAILLLLIAAIVHYYSLFKKNHIGLNPGRKFEETLQETLEKFGIESVNHLNAEYNCKGRALHLNYRFGNESQYYDNAIQSIKNIHGKELQHIDLKRFKYFLEAAEDNQVYRENPFTLLRADYSLITTDINTKIKVELPKMANLYWTNEELMWVNPAHFVRASMSVPFFFEPVIKPVDVLQRTIREAWKFWLSTEPEAICSEGVFIDGGSISNFPIDIFHESDIFYPRLPVFGVRLVDQEELSAPKGIGMRAILKSPLSFFGSIFDTLKGYNDKTFLTKYTFYSSHSIQYVDCSPSNWLNFYMDETEKKVLFNKGFRAGLDFLERFNWPQYKYERMLVALKEKNIYKQEAVAGGN